MHGPAPECTRCTVKCDSMHELYGLVRFHFRDRGSSAILAIAHRRGPSTSMQKPPSPPGRVYNRRFAANERSGLQHICGCIRNPTPHQPPRGRFPRSRSSPPPQTGIQPKICCKRACRIAANLRSYTNPRPQRPMRAGRRGPRTSRRPDSLQRKGAALAGRRGPPPRAPLSAASQPRSQRNRPSPVSAKRPL